MEWGIHSAVGDWAGIGWGSRREGTGGRSRILTHRVAQRAPTGGFVSPRVHVGGPGRSRWVGWSRGPGALSRQLGQRVQGPGCAPDTGQAAEDPGVNSWAGRGAAVRGGRRLRRRGQSRALGRCLSGGMGPPRDQADCSSACAAPFAAFSLRQSRE